MSENNIALFKLALIEGLSNRIDRQIADCTESIEPSPAHDRAMNKIITAAKKKALYFTRLRRAVAILVAAALLLTGCAVVYRDEIREFIEEIYESFLALNYTDNVENDEEIADIYELTYLPDGYSLKKTYLFQTKVKYLFENSAGNRICYEQRVLDSFSFYADVESGYKKMIDGIASYDIYYKETKEYIHYVWNDGKYIFKLTFDVAISIEELKLVIEGIK